MALQLPELNQAAVLPLAVNRADVQRLLDKPVEVLRLVDDLWVVPWSIPWAER